MDRTILEPLGNWLAQVGLSEATLEPQGEILVVKLPPGDRNRLLSDSALRQDLIQWSRRLGFSRITLEL